MTFRPNQFRSKADAQSRAKRAHACLDCRHSQPETWKLCPNCGGKNRQYFMSAAELSRGMSLLLMRDQGMIDRLRFQPRYKLQVNGRDVCTYVADAEYYRDGKLVTEDSKPESFMDNAAKIKIALFEAVYGMTVTIPQRKSGTRK